MLSRQTSTVISKEAVHNPRSQGLSSMSRLLPGLPTQTSPTNSVGNPRTPIIQALLGGRLPMEKRTKESACLGAP